MLDNGTVNRHILLSDHSLAWFALDYSVIRVLTTKTPNRLHQTLSSTLRWESEIYVTNDGNSLVYHVYKYSWVSTYCSKWGNQFHFQSQTKRQNRPIISAQPFYSHPVTMWIEFTRACHTSKCLQDQGTALDYLKSLLTVNIQFKSLFFFFFSFSLLENREYFSFRHCLKLLRWLFQDMLEYLRAMTRSWIQCTLQKFSYVIYSCCINK